jgi:hypothetical protein
MRVCGIVWMGFVGLRDYWIDEANEVFCVSFLTCGKPLEGFKHSRGFPQVKPHHMGAK